MTIQGQILAQVQTLATKMKTAVIWITHDLSVVSGLANRIAVMYAGRIVEEGATTDVLVSPAHPYTRGLLRSLPSHNRPGESLTQIPGAPPRLLGQRVGCAFAPRCDQARGLCVELDPAATAVGNRAVRCHFALREEVTV